MGETSRLVLAAALVGVALTFGGCSSDATGDAAAAESASEAQDEGGLSGQDLEIAQANCEAYEAAVEPTRGFHEELAAGPVTDTIANWMKLYETARAGLELEPVPTAPELNQAFTGVSTAYDDALTKLDGYTGATDMSSEVIAWNQADFKVEMLCADLATS